jgi:HD-GYP domain-containing protein (c-di-GMP phosphodiesterase class II)
MGLSITPDQPNSTPDQPNSTGSLQEGMVLPADLCDIHGGKLLQAGLPVTQALIDHLAQMGTREVFLDDNRTKNSSSADSTLLAPYNPLLEQQLEHNYLRITQALSTFNDGLLNGHPTSTDELELIVADYLQTAIQDTGAVMANCMGDTCAGLDAHQIQSHDAQLQRRSVRLAILSTVTASQMKLPESECMTAGIVGAVHDIALYGRGRPLYDDNYFEHPLRSIDLLGNAFGMTDQMRLITGQVHEQCDGSGYPRHLKSVRLHMVSRILNVVDAYLTLIDPIDADGPGFAPSDALAYLVQQSLYGAFDRDCVQALIMAASIYPVGTKVQLDDGTSATVMRSTGRSYLRPIIKIDNYPHTLIDLRFSERSIVRPDESNQSFRRLPKASLAEVLWRPAL